MFEVDRPLERSGGEWGGISIIYKSSLIGEDHLPQIANFIPQHFKQLRFPG